MPIFENLKNSTNHKKHQYYRNYKDSDAVILLKLFNLYEKNLLQDDKLDDLLIKINKSDTLTNFIISLKSLPLHSYNTLDITDIQNKEKDDNDDDIIIKINI
ncbi:hypothetical protein QKU48_gp1319 [Fadolivirus algeromassiliense]|jgi:hypothetical protein|uniref:Uncharacterized protein n=1 Tax=Fadolivirus FV1/VV64 TaxID=3070911 RepID=A0A7D3V983_9VIRU|nr:hypothetical protein QKU48_gp1319 [Fadolivirus algeromassiliense]QKF94777.1 hypothetical protein Fadolivirus_1_1319 [Fadolivirus FV1/VV64]